MSQTKAQLVSPVGILTASGLNVSGVVTATGFSGNVTGNVTGNATGLSGTPNIIVGIITANTELDVGVGGTVLSVFSSTGRVGIRTSNPIQPFQVGAAGTNIVVIDNIGEVGIGTTNPVSKLDLFGASTQSIVSIAASDINCGLGNYFIDTVNGSKTYTVSGVVTDRAYSFALEVTHTTGTITWFSGVEWPNGTAPTLTTGKTHLFMFLTDNGGSRWRASSLINYTN